METHNWITIFLASMRLGDTPVPIPNTTVKTQEADGTALETVWESRWMPDPLKKNREKFYYNKTGIDIQNPVTPERSYEIPFELKRSVPTHISREVLLHITGFTSDQRIEQKFSFLMTDKASVESFAQAERACTLKTAYTK